MSLAIQVENLNKRYQLGSIGHGMLYRDLQSWWAKLRGTEDPNASIGESKPKMNEPFWALRDVSFSVAQGEIVGIIGRNGAGKSTLLKILSRVTSPTSGSIKIKGKLASLLEVGTGFHPELTGRENVYLNGAILGMSKKEIRQKFDEIIAFAEIEQFIDTPVKRYSSGMYVRLAFAVAAHLEPDILVVDEVLAVGDIQFQKKCLQKMGDIGRSGCTVLIVSHNITTIKRLCSEGVLLDKGKVVSIGGINKVTEDYINTVIGHGQSGVYVHEGDTSVAMSLSRVELLDREGNITPQVPFNEPFSVKIHYNVNQPLQNASVWVGLETADGIVVFNSCDYDSDVALLGLRQAGRFTATVNIPAYMLNTGYYRLVVGLNCNRPVVSFARVETVTIEVMEQGCLDAILFPKSDRKGVLQPRLEWVTDRIG